MKRLLFISAMMYAASAAYAQTVYFWKDNVALAVEASAVGDMTYSQNGTVLTVIDSAMNVQNLDSITIGTPVNAQTVNIAYAGDRATAVIPYAIARKLNIAIDGAYVTATSSAIDGEEIAYALSGSSNDGAFTQQGTFKCTVSFNNVSLVSQRGAAVNIANGKRIRMVLEDGTTNTFADAAGGTQKACFYVKGHPEFEGNGTLNVTGNKAHAISTGEYMEVKSGNINVLSAANDGIHAGQYFKLTNGNITVKNAKGDGIQADVTKDPTDELNGQMIIAGGTININAQSDDVKALCCDSLMTISGGDITLNVKGNGTKGIATDGTLNIDQSTAATKINITINGGVYTNPVTLKESKTRGIKVDGDLNVLAGSLTINATGKKAKTINLDGTSTRGKAAVITLNDDFTFDKTVN